MQADGRLRANAAVNLATLEKVRVIRKLGDLPHAVLQEVNIALKVALELP